MMIFHIEKNKSLSHRHEQTFDCNYNGFIFKIYFDNQTLRDGRKSTFNIAYTETGETIWSKHKHLSFLEMIELLDEYLMNKQEK